VLQIIWRNEAVFINVYPSKELLNLLTCHYFREIECSDQKIRIRYALLVPEVQLLNNLRMLIVKLLLIRVSIHSRGDLSQVFLRNLSVELDVKEQENFG
jgi:hypothetical protein